ncbi:MAG: hypothetical protein ACK4KT_03900 [Thermaurantimonas sp.]
MKSFSPKTRSKIFRRIRHIIDDTKIVLGFVYLLVILLFFLFLLLELKRYYSIDLIPGYDSPIDDLYGAMKGIISELIKKLFGEEVRI